MGRQRQSPDGRQTHQSFRSDALKWIAAALASKINKRCCVRFMRIIATPAPMSRSPGRIDKCWGGTISSLLVEKNPRQDYRETDGYFQS